jgi:hypothetical protein
MYLAAFKPATPTIERLQFHALDLTVIRICFLVLGSNSNVPDKLETFKASRETVGI